MSDEKKYDKKEPLEYFGSARADVGIGKKSARVDLTLSEAEKLLASLQDVVSHWRRQNTKFASQSRLFPVNHIKLTAHIAGQLTVMGMNRKKYD